MINAAERERTEHLICSIAQKGKAVGIHLVLATQCPATNVITGLVKVNFPCRIAFNVASGIDSRVVLDVRGAEALIGCGDMLLSCSYLGKPLRVQGCFVSDEEIRSVVEAWKSQVMSAAETGIVNK